VPASLGQALLSSGEAAADEQQPLLEVHVLPAQREHFAEPQTGVEQQPERFAITAILDCSSVALGGVSCWVAGSVASELAAARQGFDLLDLVVVERGRRVFAALVSAGDGIGGELVRVVSARVGEHRREHLAVLVDVSRFEPSSVERAQAAADLGGRDLASGPVTERGHEPPGARAFPAAVGPTRLTKQEAVVGDRRGLRAPDLL